MSKTETTGGVGYLMMSWLQVFLVIAGMLVSCGMTLGYTFSRISNAEKDIVMLKEESCKKEEINKAVIKNLILMNRNLRNLMAKSDVTWSNDLPENYFELTK